MPCLNNKLIISLYVIFSTIAVSISKFISNTFDFNYVSVLCDLKLYYACVASLIQSKNEQYS